MALGDSMREALLGFSKQFKYGLALAEGISAEDAESCALVGMGGSALAGDLLNCWIPELGLQVQRNYSCPLVDSTTLLFACSYSGNTEETLSAFKEAFDSGAQVVAIASGGRLEEEALGLGLPFVKLPEGIQPRCATGYFFSAMTSILEESGFFSGRVDEVSDLHVSADEQTAKKMASKLKGVIPLVYSSDEWEAVARTCKIKFNENAKIPAFYNVFPELDHNEMVGFANPMAKFHALLLRDSEDHERVKKRMDATQGLLEKKGVKCSSFEMQGASRLEKMFSTLYFFDWVSFSLALAYGIDPEPVEMVEDLKRQLAD